MKLDPEIVTIHNKNFWRLSKVMNEVHLKRSEIKRLIKSERFPLSYVINKQVTYWSEYEIKEWISINEQSIIKRIERKKLILKNKESIRKRIAERKARSA